MVGLSEWCFVLWHTQDVALQMLLAHSYTRQNFSSLRCMRGQNEQVNHCPVTFTQRMYCGGSISHPLCSFHKSLSVLGPCSEYTREMALCLPREGPTWFHTQDTTQSFPLLHAGPRALLVLQAVPRLRSALTASARRPCPCGAAHSYFPSTVPHQQKSPGAAVPPDHFSNPLQCYHCMCCRASATKRVGHARGPDGPSPPPTLAPINLCKPCQQSNLKTSFKKPPALTFKQENLFVSASCFGR